jgi:hypothetical protein
MTSLNESFMFTVGKVDAGMAILIGERAHLIEFPSLLLPPGVSSGSIVNIAVHRNLAEEKRQRNEFWELQDQIYESFGKQRPEAPKLEVRNTTQTSVTLEWPPLKLATAKLRSLDIYRNGQRLAAIPTPHQNTSTKLSGLDVNTEYTFQLVLRTTAGTFPSNLIRVRTHTINDTSGISVCFGTVEDPRMLDLAKASIKNMGAKWSEKIQIDTTHFVCSTPASTPAATASTGNAPTAPGVEYQKALQLSIPIVQPHWVLACDYERKMVPIAGYYLGVQPPPLKRPPAQTPTSPRRSDSLKKVPAAPPASDSPPPPPPPASEATAPAPPPLTLPTNNQNDSEEAVEPAPSPTSSTRPRNGTMNKNFKFPPVSPTEPPPELPKKYREGVSEDATTADTEPIGSPEIPPPVPVEKEDVHTHGSHSDLDDDVGETVEVDLN